MVSYALIWVISTIQFRSDSDSRESLNCSSLLYVQCILHTAAVHSRNFWVHNNYLKTGLTSPSMSCQHFLFDDAKSWKRSVKLCMRVKFIYQKCTTTNLTDLTDLCICGLRKSARFFRHASVNDVFKSLCHLVPNWHCKRKQNQKKCKPPSKKLKLQFSFSEIS